jgi:membrane-bound metal-dependent hydrolase YbcI (DUF457 family)
MPIAASLSLPLAAGAVWWGMTGAGFPDWLDLRSDFRTSMRLRHRGISHSVILAAGISLGFGIVLEMLNRNALAVGDWQVRVPDAAIWPWYLCFLFGIFSHLLSDAMTYGGIRPLLPFSQVKFWVLPRFLRSRYDGYLDTLLRWLAIVVIAFFVALRMFMSM